MYHLKVISFNQAKEFRERRVGQTLKKKNRHIWTKKIGGEKELGQYIWQLSDF